MNRDTKTFQNPSGHWEYKGPFSVELTKDASTDLINPSAIIEGTKVTVAEGYIKQTMGGIQFCSGNQSFYWGYPKIKEIRDGGGNLIWVNDNYR